MKNTLMNHLAKLAAMVAIAVVAAAVSLFLISLSFPKAKAGDGLLPLGDGTLPLRMQGFATEVAENGGGSSQLTATVLLASVTRADESAEHRSCTQLGNQALLFRVGGRINVGHESFTIAAICYDEDTRRVELQATQDQTGRAATLVGAWSIAGNAPRLNGRLSDGGTPLVHYQVSLQK